MEKDLLETQEQRNYASASFKTLKTTAGWVLLVEMVETNIKLLEQQILDGSEGETTETINRKRDKLKAYREVIGLPNKVLKTLETNETLQQDDDPYFNAENYKQSKQTR